MKNDDSDASLHDRIMKILCVWQKFSNFAVMQKIVIILAALVMTACGGKKATAESVAPAPEPAAMAQEVAFDADSAYSYVAQQVAFGPRVPNTEAHRKCGEWLVSQLQSRGAKVMQQRAQLKAFDATSLDALNIFAQFNPEAKGRVLLLAHWDCRPWADKDPDPSKRALPVDGANDGASGVGVLLEVARQMAAGASGRGVDILLVDAEDWGSESDEESWALGTRYFVNNPPISGYAPDCAILLDMVGGEGATFYREYFSEKSAPALAQKIWGIAAERGYADTFPNRMGTAVNDDHLQLIAGGIPAIDIIEYHPGSDSGFNPRWHTSSDNMEGIDRSTLKAVGETVMQFITTTM